MSDETYALGHSANHPVPMRHFISRLPNANGPAELHITGEDGLHYLFSLTSNQVWVAIRQMTENKSRMDTRKGGEVPFQ